MTPDSTAGPLRRDRQPGVAPAAEPVPPFHIARESVSAAPGATGPDLVTPDPSARIAGDLRRPLNRFPTDPIGVVSDAPGLADSGEVADAWAPTPAPASRPRLAGWALGVAIVALVGSWFVGWGIPVALIAVGMAVTALRRPAEPHTIAVWALMLGVCATAFSLGWLIWAAMALEKLG